MAFVSQKDIALIRKLPALFKKSVSSVVVSAPPENMCRVVNIYINPSTNKLVVDWDDSPGGVSAGIISLPPKNMCKITNIFVNPETEKMEVFYESDPI